MKPATAQRLHLALISATAALLVQALGYKFGFRGKYQQWESITSWSEVVAVAPNFIILSLAVASLVYFWPRYR